MKIKSFLFAIFLLAISCFAYSQDSAKTTMHHHTSMTHHKHHKHHKHMMKEGSMADKKEDKKEAMEKKSMHEKKMEKKADKK